MGPRSDAHVEEVIQDSQPESGGQQDDGPVAKRACRHHDSDFQRGTVKKIRVHDFMTYVKTVAIKPGPRLNLVLGPNGTGKSSLVCALCVGLAGSTKLLGRADNLKDYVRRGCNRCWTEITLSGGLNRADIIIKRQIDVEHVRADDGTKTTSYKSKFWINNVSESQEEVKRKVKDLNIQFDNLCQFLPQDKVVEFARMDPVELLVATEKALGDSTLYTLHQQLIQERQQVKIQEAEYNRADSRLSSLKTEHDRQKNEYERVAQREQLLAEVKLMQDKVEWLKVADAKTEVRECKEALAAATKLLKKLEAETHQDEGPAREMDASLKKAEKARDNSKKEQQKCDKALKEAMKQVEDIKDDLENSLEQQKGLQADSERRKQKIAEIQREISDLEADLARLPTSIPQDLVQRLEELQQRGRAAIAAQQDLADNIKDQKQLHQDLDRECYRLESQFQALANTKYQRLQDLVRSDMGRRVQGLQDVYEFMMQNRQNFKGPVYGPVALEIDMRSGPHQPNSDKWASYLEKQCGTHLFNFVTSCREDETMLSAFIRQQRSGVVVTTVTYDFNKPIHHPKGESSQYGAYGITRTLDEVFDAPLLVKHMLCDICRINSAYVGGEETVTRCEGNVPIVFKECPIREVYTGDHKTTFTVSHYNRDAPSLSVDAVFQARTLSGESLTALERERERVGAQLTQAKQAREAKGGEIAALERQQAEHVQQAGRCEAGIKEIHGKQQQIMQQRAKKNSDLGLKKRKLQTTQAEPDPLDKAAALKQQSKQLVDKMAAKGGELLGLSQAYWQAMRNYMMAELTVKEMEAQLAILKARMQEQRSAVSKAQEQRNTAERVLQAAQDKFNEAKEHAMEVAPLDDERKAAMAELTDDSEELMQLAANKQAEADAIVVSDPGVIRQYQARQQQIDEMSKQVASAQSVLNVAKQALEMKKNQWLPDLQRLVVDIDKRFGTNFKEIGCAGEVKLLGNEDYDFDKFAIQIWVQFRASEGMQLLTANRQSGGERSVSTILYLIALQGITETPFRVVDEINQGMDPVNERKVFIQLVESSCKPDTPQCFLLTPKLLPGLPFEEQISVLNIMNGTSAIDPQLIKACEQAMDNKNSNSKLSPAVQLMLGGRALAVMG